ncbi:MAG: aldo/keto reductase [Thermoplasmataceae archaeon]
MKSKKLGNTGIIVSELCLGTMTFGWQADESSSHKILSQFFENGGNFIDTADVYSDGKSEEIIGKWLEGNDRENVILATKSRFRTGAGKNSVGLTRKHLYSGVKASLKRLHTDYIDILQTHAWDPLTPLEETFGALNSLVEEGLIRYVGISNFRGWQFEKALQLCKSKGWSLPISIQPHYNILVRATEFEILPMALAENIAVIPWSPLAGGILSGKYKSGIGKAERGTRVGDSSSPEMYRRYENEKTKKVLEELERISKEIGKTMAQISLNWLMRNPAVTSPIIGARTTDQLRENLGSTGWQLTKEQIEAINRVSFPEVSYPYDQRAEEQQTRDREIKE